MLPSFMGSEDAAVDPWNAGPVHAVNRGAAANPLDHSRENRASTLDE
jgi:hypothetical protein